MRDDALEREAAVLQETGQILAHHAVNKETGCDDHDRRADNAPAGQQHERDAETGHDRIEHGVGAGAELQRGIVHDKVTGHTGKRSGQNAVIPGKLMAVRLLRGGVEEVGHGNRQAEVGVAQDLEGHLVGNGRVELEQCPQRQHNFDDLLPLFGKDFVL